MDQKNTIAAIALSSCVIVLWALFFTSPEPTKEEILAKKESLEKTETPKIEKTETIKELSIEESISSTERIIFENNNIIG